MALCSALSLFLFLMRIYVAAANENCPFTSASPNLTNIKWNAGVCYFTVKEATTEANTKVNGTHWTFDISAARRICAAQNATLPIFDDDQEHTFAHENYRGQFDGLEVSQLALGQHKVVRDNKEHERWDDGTKIGQFKDTSIGKLVSDAAYAVLSMSDNQKVKEWQWHRSDKTWEQPVAVLCQRRQSQPDKNRRINMCNTPIEYFPEVHPTARTAGRISEDLCLFVVTGSSLLANEKIGDRYVFNLEKARQLCQRYGATLPRILSYDDCAGLSPSIVSTLRNIERDEGKVSTMLEVALGIGQEPSGNGFAYKWDTGEEIIYQNKWEKKYSEAAYTKITFDLFTPRAEMQPCVWENVWHNETLTDGPLLTLCEHRLTEPKPWKPIIKEHGFCSPQSPWGAKDGRAMFQGACYFILPAESPNVSIAVARDVCAEYGGVLPTIASEEENSFMATTFRQDGYPAILGVRQVRRPDEYQWIDGSPLSYEPSKWEARDSYAYATILVLETGDWKNVAHFEKSSHQWIICKEVEGTSEETESTSTVNGDKTSSNTGSTRKDDTATSIDDVGTATTSTDEDRTTTSGTHTTAETTSTSTSKGISTATPEKVIMGSCPSNSSTAIIVNAKENNGVCYFTIQGATAQSNTKIDETNWTFNISAARRICASQNATLPIFDDEDEHSFVLANYRTDFDGLEIAQLLALGLHRDTRKDKEYQWWDDGTKIGHFKDTSISDVFSDAAFAVAFLTGSQRIKVWQWYASSKTLDQPVAVLCQRRERQPGKIRRVNMCETPIEYFPEIHPEARMFGGKNADMCLFVITGSSLILNEKVLDIYVYNIGKARQLCHRYGATLPTVFSYEECRQVSSGVYAMRQIELEYGNISTANGAALGITQDVSSNGIVYKWDTGDEVAYEGVWPKKYVAAAHTKVAFGSVSSEPFSPTTCVWENIPHSESAREHPLITVCQHRLTAREPSKPERNKISICSPESNRDGIAMKAVYKDACYFRLSKGPVIPDMSRPLCE